MKVFILSLIRCMLCVLKSAKSWSDKYVRNPLSNIKIRTLFVGLGLMKFAFTSSSVFLNFMSNFKIQKVYWKRVRTTKIRTSKVKKNIQNLSEYQNVESLFEVVDQNIENHKVEKNTES
jgi:hypothetical protein